MLIAQQKLKENIAEYIIYMWQVEGLVRSLNFDLSLIKSHIVDIMTSNEDARKDVLAWYEQLVDEMKQDDLIVSGHLKRVNLIIEEVVFLHNTLLTKLEDDKYKAIFTEAYPFIEELRAKSNNEANDIEICLTAVYGKLLLKMKKQEISKETEKAMQVFTIVLAYLSQKYKEFKSGKLRFEINN